MAATAADQRAPPLDELVSHADRHTDRDDEKRLPAFAIENVESNKQFARDQRRHESLREMSEPVVMITAPVKNFLEPVEEWLVCVGPMAADAENADVNSDQGVNECGELKSAVSGGQNDQPDDSRKNFEPPSEPIMRMNSGPDENDRDTD